MITKGLAPNYIIYQRTYRCWTVRLFGNGNLVAYSNYKRRVNIEHHIPVNEYLIDSYDLVPGYVFTMLLDARYVMKGL